MFPANQRIVLKRGKLKYVFAIGSCFDRNENFVNDFEKKTVLSAVFCTAKKR